MPVITAYSTSTSGSSYNPSYRYKSSFTDRRTYTTSSGSSSSFSRRNSYRYDLPTTTSSYLSSSSYRTSATASSPAADRTTDAELSTSLSALATVSSPAAPATATESSTIQSKIESAANRYSRYTSSYGSRSSYGTSRSSDSHRSSIRDRDNNCLCAVGGAGSSSSYLSNLRSSALSGAEVYQKYSISSFNKPSAYDRILAARAAASEKQQSTAPSSGSSILASTTAATALDVSKATIRLRPSLNGSSGNSNTTNGVVKARFIATASATTDDLVATNDCSSSGPGAAGDYHHVTATIRIKPKSSISTTSTNNNINNNNNNNNNNIVNGTSCNGIGERKTKKNGNNNNERDREEASDSDEDDDDDGDEDENDDDEDKKQRRDVDGERSQEATPAVDKEPSKPGDDEKVYLRTGTASKSIHSTSPVGYRSRDYDSSTLNSNSYRSSLGTSSSSAVQKSSYDRSNNEDSSDSLSRTGGSRKEGLCGLWNIGNTCFMNSVIQCLSHTRELTNYLRNQPSTERGTNKDHKILAEYTKLIKDMWSGTNRSVNPSELKNAFSSKHRMYSGSAQQDAQEFLRFFIDSLHGALNVSVKREPIDRSIEDDDMNNRVKANMMWDWYSKVENSMIKDLFVGLLRSTLKCTVCNNASVTFDPFWDLSLPLPSTNSRCKLENCLDMFVKEEVMDGIDQPTCSKCKTRRKCTKSFAIERFPKYLVIHLKRFSETRWSKLTNVIEFPTGDRELNLQSYASEDNIGPVNYSLYGISNHMGSTAGGHYIAVCKHPVSKEWNEFNDNFVSETSERSLVTSSAYVLFYERA